MGVARERNQRREVARLVTCATRPGLEEERRRQDHGQPAWPMRATVAAGVVKENLLALPPALAPPAVTTITSTFPFGSAGVVAVIEVFDFTTKAAETVANSTLEAPEKPVPVMITTVPPVVGPESGVRVVTVGRGGRKVNRSAAPVALLPPPVVTVTSTSAGADAGATAVTEEFERTVNDDAGSVPKSTAVAPFRFTPEMVSLVPPVDGPEVGLMPVTLGGGTTNVK